MSIVYANSGSGPSAGGIGWINFGSITIVPGQAVRNVTGTLTDGTTITFDIASASTSSRNIITAQEPTFQGANFGTTGYRGISGYVALQTDLQGKNDRTTLNISNIVVRDSDRNIVNNYTMVVADAETTNTNEFIEFTTNGGDWNRLAQIGANPPTLSGIGTKNAKITGVSYSTPAAYVLTTQSPTSASITLGAVDTIAEKQAVSIGFAVTRIALRKNIGSRLDVSDQFTLNIGGKPSSTFTTTGSSSGIQSQIASVFATPNTSYSIDEIMASGSTSTLTDYEVSTSAVNATQNGTIPPTGALPISITPQLGDIIVYTILDGTPQRFIKSVDKEYADVGDILTYTVTMPNPNNYEVTDITLTDHIPLGTTFVDGSLVVNGSTYTGTSLDTGITIDSIPAQGEVTVSWKVTVGRRLMPSQLNNMATASLPDGRSGNTNIVTTNIRHADLISDGNFIKSVDETSIGISQIITYTLDITNTGNTSANNVVITDNLPANTTYINGSITTPVGFTGDPTTSINLTDPIAPNQTVSISFKVQGPDTIPPNNPLQNQASIEYTYTVDPANPDAAFANGDSNIVDTTVKSTNINEPGNFTKTVDKAFAEVGDTLTYTATVRNTGNVAANNVVITDTMPNGTTFVDGSVESLVPFTGTSPESGITLTNPIAVGETVAITYQATVDTMPVPNPIENIADIEYTYIVNPLDPNEITGNATTNPPAITTVDSSNLESFKAVDKAVADITDIVTYTIIAKNTGGIDLNNVVLTDIMPSGVTFETGSITSTIPYTGDSPETGIILTNSIPKGGEVIITYKAKVTEMPEPNPIKSPANITYTYTLDPANPDGESSTVETNQPETLVNHADLISGDNFVKSVDKEFAELGDIITYTFTVKNTGNVDATNVVITDPVPAGTKYVDGSISVSKNFTGDPKTSIKLSEAIKPNEAITISFKVTIANTLTVNQIPNQAQIDYIYKVDPSATNGKSANGLSNLVSTQVNSASLTTVKSTDKNISYIDDIITYKIAVTNNGNFDANNVVVKDPIPFGTSYVEESLTIREPHTGDPTSSIILTDPIKASETVYISFKVKVDEVPNPNPINNKAVVDYTYTVNPQDPDGVSKTSISNIVKTYIFRYNFGQQVTDIIQSIALEEASLAAIADAEGRKIQAAVDMEGITQQELLAINKSVQDMLDSIALLESILKQKLNTINCQINPK